MADIPNPPLTKFPAWRQCIEDVIAEQFELGAVIPDEWWWRHLEIVAPTPITPWAKAQEVRLRFLAAMEKVKKGLLYEHQVALARANGRGWYIMPPREQTDWADREARKALQKTLADQRGRLGNVRLEELDDSERRHNADRMERAAALGAMIRRERFFVLPRRKRELQSGLME
jgi:hypothetical protein